MFFQKNNVFIGLLMGLALPIVVYAVVLTIFEGIDASAGFTQVELAKAIKPRTLWIIAICINILVMQYYRRLRAEESMRGVFIAVGILAIAWFARYYNEIFSAL